MNTNIYVNGALVHSTRDSWEESKHPRANNGQFGHGSGSSKKTSHAGHAAATKAKAIANAGHEALKKHPMYTKEDYEYLSGKGYTAAEIKALWDRDQKLGKDPQHGNKHSAENQKLVEGVARAMGKGSKGKDSAGSMLVGELDAPEAGAGKGKPLYAGFGLSKASEDALAGWAAGYGIALPSWPHVTVAYSKAPVEWADAERMSEGLVVLPGGRSYEQFGDDVVLTLDSPELQKRWDRYKAMGASWDYPSYRPHITLMRNASVESMAGIPVYDEPIILGPEKLDEIRESWHSSVAAGT